MKGTMKKFISVVLTLAMIVTGLQYSPRTTVSAAQPDWSSIEWAGDGAGGGAYSNKYKFYGTNASLVNIQHPGFASEAGLYVTFPAGISACSLSGYDVQGAGIIIYLSNFTQQVTEFTVTQGGNVETCYVYYADGVAETTTEATTPEVTTATPETTTVAPETTTEETTEAPLNWQTDANLTAYFGSGARYAYVTSNPGNGDDKFLGGNFTFNASNMNCTTGAYGNSQTYTFNGKVINTSSESYALGENIAYADFNPGMNTAVFIGHYTAGESDIDVTCTMYIDVPNKPMGLSINDYSEYTGKYIAKFKEANDVENYKVYVDGVATSIELGGSGDYFTVAELNDAGYSADTYAITITGVDAEDVETPVSNSVSVSVPATAGTNGDIAQIYIQTDNTNLSPTPQDGKETMLKTPHDKQEAAITVVDKDGGNSAYTVFEDLPKTTVKVRGNSTAGAVKKAYNITFGSGKDLFGLDGSAKSAKKWSLLANAFDKSLIRNYLGFDIAHHMWANGTTPDYNSQCKFVDLYFNGVYLGNYLLIESVETGAGRVNIDSENSETYNSEALLELEEIHAIGEEAHFTTTRYNQTFIFGSPEVVKDIGNNAEFFAQKQTDVAGFFNDFETDLYNEDWTAIQADIDVESFVKLYVLNEIMTTKDFNQSSTRFYVHNGKIYGGPIWDMDYSSDNNLDHPAYTAEYQIDAPGHSMPWFEHLMDIPEFKALVVAEYKSIRSYVMSLYADNGVIDTLLSSISGSATRNYTATANGGAGWSIDTADTGDSYGYMQMIANGVAGATAYTSYNAVNDSTSAVAQVKNYFEHRIAGLDETWNVSYEASVSTENDEVVVSWDAMEGATGYRLTFLGKYTAPVSPTPLLAANPLMAVQQIADDYTTQTVDVSASATSYNLTDAGYEVEDGTDITVAYSTDNGNTYTTLASAQYNAAPAEQGYENITVNARAENYKIFANWTNPDGTAHSYAYINSVSAGNGAHTGGWDFNTQATQPMTSIDNVTRTRDSSIIVEYGNTYTVIVESYDSNDNLIGRGEAEVTIPNASQEEILKNRVGQLDNLARNKTPMVGSNSGTANNLVDGNTGNRWQADKAVDNTYFGVDLENVYSIDRVLVCWEGSCATDYNVQVSTDGENYTTVATVSGVEGSSLDQLSTFEPVNARYVKIVATALSANATNYGLSAYELAVFAGDIAPAVNDAGWVQVPNSSHYWYYVPNSYSFNVNTAGATMQGNEETIYFPFYGQINTTPKSATLGSTDLTNTGNAQVWLPTSLIASNNTVYKLTFVDNDDEKVVVYFKKQTEANYTPTGIAITQAGVMTWTPSADATTAGATYSVTFNGSTTNNISTGTTTLDLTGVEYDTYPVVLKTYVSGSEVDSQTTQFVYRDPEQIDTTFTTTKNWEKDRNFVGQWTAVQDVTGYAVYVDGELYNTLASSATSVTIPAYDFAGESLNNNSQPTTVGDHSVKVVALFESEEAPTYSNINTKHVVGTDNFHLYINYVYGSGTDLWNDTSKDSSWNFTICEEPVGQITTGADVYVDYQNDGSVDLRFDNMGLHNTLGQQPWTIKAAVYDQPVTVGETVHLSFDIVGPASILDSANASGKQLTISLTPEEVLSVDGQGNTTYGEAYIYKTYTFQEGRNASNERVAVIHYEESFTATNDTYDLLFGLGELDFGDAEQKTLTLSDTTHMNLYGLNRVSATGIYNNVDPTMNSIYTTFISEVPENKASDYTYSAEVYSGDTKVGDTIENFTSGTSITAEMLGVATLPVGDYVVKVTSIFNNGASEIETDTKQANATIENVEAPDVVISSLTISPSQNADGNYRVGDTIQLTYTMKNIGTATATPIAGKNLVTYIAKNEIDVGGTYDTSNALAINGEFTVTNKNYTLTAQDVGSIRIGARADSDGAVEESNENNNLLEKTITVYPALEELDLENNGTEVVAEWDAITGAEGYKISYTSNGEAITTNEISSTQYTFTTNYPDNNTDVNLWIVESDGSEVLVQHKRALADLAVTSAGVVGEVVHRGQAANVQITVKNVGTAKAEKVVNNEFSGQFPVKVAYGAGLDEEPADWTEITEGAYAHSSVAVLEPNQSKTTTIENAITAAMAATSGAGRKMLAVADDASRGNENYDILEEDDPTRDISRNNFLLFTYAVIEQGTLTLASSGSTVTGTWTTDSSVTGYKISYTTVENNEQVTKTVTITNENATTDDVNGTMTYTFTDPLVNQSTVRVTAAYDTIGDDTPYYTYATDTAAVDFVITSVLDSENKGTSENRGSQTTQIPFNLTVTVKNQGTATYPATGLDHDEYYGSQLFVSLQAQENVKTNTIAANNDITVGPYVNGLNVGASTTFTISDIVVTRPSAYQLAVKVDDPGFSDAKENGFIAESNENNNMATYYVNVAVSNEGMDWTPLYESKNGYTVTYSDGTVVPAVEVASSTYQASLEYKILDTSITDMDYDEIMTTYESYGGFFVSMGFTNSYTLSGGDTTNTDMYWIQTTKDVIDNYSAQSIIDYGSERVAGDGVLHTYNGNGLIINVNTFAEGKYYLMKLEYNYTEDDQEKTNSVIVAFRVVGSLEDWVKVRPTGTGAEQLPLYYHTNENFGQQTGTIYYDGTDLGLAVISSYNSTHLAITTDGGSREINQDNCRITVQYASLDENGNVIASPSDELIEEIGLSAASTVYEPTIYGFDGTNTIQIASGTLFHDVPVHSSEGGAIDSEYYIVKVYYDTEQNPVIIPMRVVMDIPEIEEPQSYSVWTQADGFYINFTETTLQQLHDYSYEFYLDGTKITSVTKNGVEVTDGIAYEGGTYKLEVDSVTAERLLTVGETFQVQTVAKWCEQSVTKTSTYTVELPDGKVGIEGFQVNTNANEGGVSEHMPTFRAVAYASKQFVGQDNKIHGTSEYGLIYYAPKQGEEKPEINSDTMVLDSSSSAIKNHAAQVIHGWGGKEDKTNYFSLTMKEMEYDSNYLTREFSFRAYAILDNGEVKYGNEIYTVSTYEIAKYLYENEMMTSKTAHDFLYNQILNIVAIKEQYTITGSGSARSEIALAMNKALKDKYEDAAEANRIRNEIIQPYCTELLYYANCYYGYNYNDMDRQNGTFTCKRLDSSKQAELLEKLNSAQDADYTSIFDWIMNEASSYTNNSGVHYKGFYEKVEYSWGKKYSTAFDTEE
ncbi:MAG: CotH kinase family protein [Eubacterium sp.]|nr:CotH kinase family protein [Eubacterium sp.]